MIQQAWKNLIIVFVLFLIVSCSEKSKKEDFLWGVAISGFQADMGPNSPPDKNSDWWVWTHGRENREKGWVKDVPENGPDFWIHYKQDIDIAKSLGINTFRYEIEWSRIFPKSTIGILELEKVADQNSVKKYREILSYMREKGLKIFLTLNHFTLPIWLHDPIACRDYFSEKKMNDKIDDSPCFGKPSGWLSETAVREFGKYVAFVAEKFGDLVDLWGPINEPIVIAMNGYLLGNISGFLGYGAFPPAAGNKNAFDIVFKNLVSAHIIAYDMIHKFDRYDADGDGIPAKVSVIYNIPFYESEDKRAEESAWEFTVWRYLDSVVEKTDVIGINYYNRFQLIYAEILPDLGIFFLPKPCGGQQECPYGFSESGWEIYPPGIYEVIKMVWNRYKGIPILITENGVSDAQDKIRSWFIKEHLKYVRKAKDEGIPVIGYFYWSLIDNLEWTLGYEKKFGLVEVDFSSPERPRKIRKSAYDFSQEIKNWE